MIRIIKVSCYHSHYVKVGDVINPDGFTIHGLPYILSKHKNNKGHRVVFNKEYFEVV